MPPDPADHVDGYEPDAAAGAEAAADRGEARFLRPYFEALERSGGGGGGGGGGTAAARGEEGDEEEDARGWMRFCQGYAGRFVDDVRVELPGGIEAVTVRQSPAAKQQQRQKQRRGGDGGSSGGGGGGGGGASGAAHDRDRDPALTATTVWDGAVVLSQYFVAAAGRGGGTWSPPAELLEEAAPAGRSDAAAAAAAAAASSSVWPRSGLRAPVLVELGTGTGLAGLVAAAAGGASAVALTDVPAVAAQGSHLCKNALINGGLIRRRSGAAVAVLPLRWGRSPAALGDLAALPAPFGLGAAVGAAAAATQEAQGEEARARASERRLRRRRRRRAGPDVVAGADLVYYSYGRETPHSRLLLQTLRALLDGGPEGGQEEDEEEEEVGREADGDAAAAAAADARARPTVGPEQQTEAGAEPHRRRPDALAVLALSLHHNPREVARFLAWAEEDFGLRVRVAPPAALPPVYRTRHVLVAEMIVAGPAGGRGR